MKVLIVVNSKKYSYHKSAAENLSRGINSIADVAIYDMEPNIASHEHFFAIKDVNPDVLITLDCAGFDMLTTGKILAYNTMPCRMAHIIIDKEYKLKNELSNRMNLSMFAYFAPNHDIDELSKKYPDIPNILKYNEGLCEDEACSRQWFEDFLKEGLLV